MNELAQALNNSIKEDNEFVYTMLSQLGKEMFYPKGILSQSAEAGKKAHRFNATIGIATGKQSTDALSTYSRHVRRSSST